MELSHFNSLCPVQHESYLPGAGLVIVVIAEEMKFISPFNFIFESRIKSTTLRATTFLAEAKDCNCLNSHFPGPK